MLVSAPAISSENVTTFEVGNAPFGADRNQLSYLFINSYGGTATINGTSVRGKARPYWPDQNYSPEEVETRIEQICAPNGIIAISRGGTEPLTGSDIDAFAAVTSHKQGLDVVNSFRKEIDTAARGFGFGEEQIEQLTQVTSGDILQNETAAESVAILREVASNSPKPGIAMDLWLKLGPLLRERGIEFAYGVTATKGPMYKYIKLMQSNGLGLGKIISTITPDANGSPLKVGLCSIRFDLAKLQSLDTIGAAGKEHFKNFLRGSLHQ